MKELTHSPTKTAHRSAMIEEHKFRVKSVIVFGFDQVWPGPRATS